MTTFMNHSLEIEQKYKIEGPSGFRSILRNLHAKKVFSGKERNEFFDLSGLLFKNGYALRLRRFGAHKTILTLKGPRQKSQFKIRPETETEVNYRTAKRVLESFRFRVFKKYEKYREEYHVQGAIVTLDYLAKRGWFLEIEGSPAKILALEKRLGLKVSARESRNYLEILGLKLR